MEKIDLDDLEELKQMCRAADLNNITRMVTGGKEYVYVVRCGECKHWGSGTKGGFGEFRKCALDGAWHGPEFFCASGERNAGATES